MESQAHMIDDALSTPSIRVEPSTLRGEWGISIGEEELFLRVERRREKWRVRLYTLWEGIKPLTPWITIRNLEELWASETLRAVLIQECGEDEWWKVLGRVVDLLRREDASTSMEAEEERGVFNPESEVDSAARELLQDPNFLNYVQEVYEQGVEIDQYRFVLGEQDAKLLVYLLSLSAKTRWPQSLWVTGDSGYGKSNIIRVTLHLMPEGYAKVVSYFTPGALRHGRKNYSLLFIEEWRSGLEQDVRLLSGEDGGYRYEIAVRDPKTGEWTTQTGEIPAKSIFTTSAEGLPSPQLLRRCWLLSVDESEELTRVINTQKALYRAGEIKPVDPEFVKVLRRCVELLDPTLDVIIPYAPPLVDIAEWDRTRLGQFLDLISIIAWLFQYQRPRDKEGRIIALPIDLLTAIQIGWRTLRQSLLKLPERLRRVYEALPENSEGIGKTTKELSLELKISQSCVRTYLADLKTLGYAVSSEGRPKYYWKSAQVLNSAQSIIKQIKWQEIASLTEKALEKASPESVEFYRDHIWGSLYISPEIRHFLETHETGLFLKKEEKISEINLLKRN
ncbi:MAG TPA: hypothetical protein ENG21_03920 [Nitrososphaeria archaeon]|nr:hypothetical protein [Nitrososphaeria archaeon]